MRGRLSQDFSGVWNLQTSKNPRYHSYQTWWASCQFHLRELTLEQYLWFRLAITPSLSPYLSDPPSPSLSLHRTNTHPCESCGPWGYFSFGWGIRRMQSCECFSPALLWCALSLTLCWELMTSLWPINSTKHVWRKHKRWSAGGATGGAENNR